MAAGSWPDYSPLLKPAGQIGPAYHTHCPSIPPMAHLILAFFLIVFGLNLLFGLSVPLWVSGILALAAGVMLLAERFGLRVNKK